MKQLNSIMRMRSNDPPYLKKGDPNKVWDYETIESVTYGEVNDFDKSPRKSYVIEDYDFNQLDFPVNHSMFIFFLRSILLRIIKILMYLRS